MKCKKQKARNATKKSKTYEELQKEETPKWAAPTTKKIPKCITPATKDTEIPHLQQKTSLKLMTPSMTIGY
ncbi:hypothetical protein F8M41_025466 [Gigaspora margarita]|uniref:Uncharacterized protein n=1 Tax=Gigaspora margarita TaxID=4874 RepID=A0A8H4ET53_GIGMA|nr:hypothetical protein F8M41_025466 [Gigaspora margarita]